MQKPRASPKSKLSLKDGKGSILLRDPGYLSPRSNAEAALLELFPSVSMVSFSSTRMMRLSYQQSSFPAPDSWRPTSVTVPKVTFSVFI